MKGRGGRRRAAPGIIILIVLTIAAGACTQAHQPSPLAGRWSSETGQRVYEIDDAGTITLGTINYPAIRGLGGTWAYASSTLNLSWKDGSSAGLAEQYTVQLGASSMTWLRGLQSLRLVGVADADNPALVVQQTAPTDPAYALSVSDVYSVDAAASTALLQGLYKSSLAVRGYASGLIVMTFDSASSDTNTSVYTCALYRKP
jgi:hypothetical protein